MESLRKKIFLIFVFVLVVGSILQISPVQAAEQYDMRGAYNENGTRQGAVNVTFTRENQSPTTFELDGTYLANASTSGSVFTWDLGYNETRTFYVYGNETIYVMLPYDPYYYYYFSMNDFIGLDWGYLESIVNINGTDRVCERQSILIVNDIPFAFTWGRSYTMRLVCNLGSYTYGDFVAGATTSFNLVVTRDMFPTIPTHIGDLSVSATRRNASWIQSIYIDSNTSTNWVNFDYHEYGNSTAFLSYNTTSNSVVHNWYGGAATVHYYVVITISHINLGSKVWTFACPAPSTAEGNPFTFLNQLGDLPFNPDQLPAVMIVVVVAMVFSWWNAPVGLIVTILIAALLVWLSWLSISWSWITISGSIIFILAIAEWKGRAATI